MMDALLDQMRRTHAGDPWYGAPRMQFLRGLPAAHASLRPAGSNHSVWELVLHMSAWTEEVRRRLAGHSPGEPLDGDWPSVPKTATESAWASALLQLERAHGALIADVERLRPEDLDRLIGDTREPALGTGVTVAATLVGLAQHDAYHTGQLALLRQLLAASEAAGERATS